MKRKSAYEIWKTKKGVLLSQIGSSKTRLIELNSQLIHTKNLIHEEEIGLDLLENNLQIAKGRVIALPNPEQKE